MDAPILGTSEHHRTPEHFFFWDPSTSPISQHPYFGDSTARGATGRRSSPASLLCLSLDPCSPCHGGDPSGRVGDPWGDAHLPHIVGSYPVLLLPLPPCPLRVPSRGGTWSLPSSSSHSLLPADFAGSVTWQELGARGRCTSGQHPHGLAMPCQHAQSCLCQMPSGSLTESLEPLAHGSDTAIAARAGIYCQGNQDELFSCDFDIVVN